MIFMMPFKRALSIAEKELPDRKFTGFAYRHGDNYYIEMAPHGTKSMPMDCMFRVDGNHATVSRYIPVIDGIIPPQEMELVL